MATTMKRQIIRIDEEKCNGCGQCVSACHEGALQLVEGKAKLVRDDYCDGLGACIGDCPQGALSFEEREAPAFDAAAVEAAQRAHAAPAPFACPSARARELTPAAASADDAQAVPSALRNWPTQLTLAPVQSPTYRDADLLVCADCVPFAYGGFHQDLLPGKVVMQACPKLDDVAFYREKLTAILAGNDIRSLTVARMEVPCCGGLVAVVRDAVAASGKDLPVEVLVAGIGGEILQRQSLPATAAAHAAPLS